MDYVCLVRKEHTEKIIREQRSVGKKMRQLCEGPLQQRFQSIWIIHPNASEKCCCRAWRNKQRLKFFGKQ